MRHAAGKSEPETSYWRMLIIIIIIIKRVLRFLQKHGWGILSAGYNLVARFLTLSFLNIWTRCRVASKQRCAMQDFKFLQQCGSVLLGYDTASYVPEEQSPHACKHISNCNFQALWSVRKEDTVNFYKFYSLSDMKYENGALVKWNWQGKTKYSEVNLSICHIVQDKNSTCVSPRINLGLCGERSVTNHLPSRKYKQTRHLPICSWPNNSTLDKYVLMKKCREFSLKLQPPFKSLQSIFTIMVPSLFYLKKYKNGKYFRNNKEPVRILFNDMWVIRSVIANVQSTRTFTSASRTACSHFKC
jgi:hypothetical protein